MYTLSHRWPKRCLASVYVNKNYCYYYELLLLPVNQRGYHQFKNSPSTQLPCSMSTYTTDYLQLILAGLMECCLLQVTLHVYVCSRCEKCQRDILVRMGNRKNQHRIATKHTPSIHVGSPSNELLKSLKVSIVNSVLHFVASPLALVSNFWKYQIPVILLLQKSGNDCVDGSGRLILGTVCSC